MLWLWVLGIIILAVIPVVIALLNNLMEPVVEIRRYGDDVLEHGVLLAAAMDGVDLLEETRDQSRQVAANVQSYGAALQQLA